MPPSPELILYPSRTKHLLFLLLCAAFAVGGVLMIRDDQGWEGWFVVGVFGPGAAIFAVQLLPGASWLRLTPSGFCFCTLFRKSAFIDWASVSPFGVTPISGNKMVVFSTEKGRRSRLAPVNIALTGETEALPDTYGRSAESLAKLLNEWRERASRSDLDVRPE